MKLEKVPGLCCAGTGDVVQQVTVEPQSATAVNFSLVPLIIGNVPITIEAYVSSNIHDKIQKELKVVVLYCTLHSISIDLINKLQIHISSSGRRKLMLLLISVYRERAS